MQWIVESYLSLSLLQYYIFLFLTNSKTSFTLYLVELVFSHLENWLPRYDCLEIDENDSISCLIFFSFNGYISFWLRSCSNR